MATNTSLWKPLPTLPGPEETQSWIRQRIAESDHSNHPANHTLSRTIEGKHGWKAILFGQISSHQTGLPYILSDLFLPLCDWWEEMAYEAVLNCPPPENVRYPATTKDGRSRMINTIKAWYEPWDIFIFDDKDCGNLHLPMDFTFEGQAPVSDIIWPFNPRALIDPMVSSVQDALGSQQLTGYAGRRRTDQLWKANHVLGRRNWKKVRIFEDWSGQTPEQRDIFTKPTPPPRKASGQWSKAPDYMATRICSGSEQCAYTPRADTQPAGSRRVVSGCDRQWQAYCASLFQAFMESNPEVQFGPRLSCLRKIRQPKHNCYRNSDQCLKSPHLLDHGQAGRFPDRQKFYISHPYCETGVNIAAHHDAQNWLEKEPELTWINEDTTRSWYFPTHSTLLITGYKQTLDRINRLSIAQRGSPHRLRQVAANLAQAHPHHPQMKIQTPEKTSIPGQVDQLHRPRGGGGPSQRMKIGCKPASQTQTPTPNFKRRSAEMNRPAETIRPRIDPYCVICKLYHPGAVQPVFPPNGKCWKPSTRAKGRTEQYFSEPKTNISTPI